MYIFFVVLWIKSINSFRNAWWLKSWRMSEFVSILQKCNLMSSVDRRVRNYFIWLRLPWPGVSFSSLLPSKSGATILTSILPGGYWGTRYCKGSISLIPWDTLCLVQIFLAVEPKYGSVESALWSWSKTIHLKWKETSKIISPPAWPQKG